MIRRLAILAALLAVCASALASGPMALLSIMDSAGGGADLTTGLAAHWLFNDLTDSSGQGNHLEKTALVTATNGVATFTGVTTNWIRTLNTNFCAGATNMAISFWVKSQTAGGEQWYFKWQTALNPSGNVGPDASARPYFAGYQLGMVIYGASSSDYILQRGTNFVPSIYTNWNHVVMQWGKTNQFSTFLNGVQLNNDALSVGGTRPDVIFPSRMYIGNSEAAAANRVFYGLQTRYRIYTNRPISADVVLQLYQEGHGQ